MALNEKLTQILQNLADVNASQSQTIDEQKKQIKQLLNQVEEGNVGLAEAERVIDEIAQKQQEQLAGQQEVASKIAAIFNPSEG